MTTGAKSALKNLDYRAMLDSLGAGIILFDAEGRFVLDNHAAREILGKNLLVVRSQGWPACAMLIDAGRPEGPTADEIRARALRQSEPVRFSLLLSGAYMPGWASAVYGEDGQVLTMISIERPDWTALRELMETFRSEARLAISSTKGHADLILQLTRRRAPGMTVDQLAQRVIGFAELMSTQMYRLQNLMDQIHRLEVIRTGELAETVTRGAKKINLAEFFEDFLEEINEQPLHDPEKGHQDYRDRLEIDLQDDLNLYAAPNYLTFILRDVLRNAIMYSEPSTPIQVRAFSTGQDRYVQIDVIDQGYGIRARETERVFAPFQRARQPQIIAEFGYGLGLYLTKANIEAMGGRIWFDSEEGVGTTFSLKLPAFQEAVEDADVD
jgi:signal transduction histidine kinase